MYCCWRCGWCLEIIRQYNFVQKTYEQTERINHSNSMAKYYNVIFDEFLIYKIPEARRYIRFEDERLTDFSKLVDELDAMLRSALYFKYTNRDFYKELKCKINELESYLAECGNNHNYEQDEQAEEFKIITVRNIKSTDYDIKPTDYDMYIYNSIHL